MHFGEEDHRGEVPLSSSYQYMLSTWLTTDDVDLDRLVEVVFVRFLHYKIIPPTHSVLLGRQSLCTAHTYRLRYYVSPPWGNRYLHKLFGVFLHRISVSPPFIYSIIYLCQYILMDISFILWVIFQLLLYFVT